MTDDPRTDIVCHRCGQTFAWREFGELCGWCWEEEHALARGSSDDVPYSS